MNRWLELIARRPWHRMHATAAGDARNRWGVPDIWVRTAPSPENAVDIFHGLWSSKFPPPFDSLAAGHAELFQDPRIKWALDQLGSIRGASVLELGPLEGGHSYMLDRAGAGRVLAIEGNTRAYLRCLVAKELLGMSSVRFACGDFMAYLRTTTDTFDLVLASGVLYHMREPVELLAHLARVSSRVVIWTHYYDAELLRSKPDTATRVVDPVEAEYGGFGHRIYRHEYGPALDFDGFCGGNKQFAYWLSRDDLLGAVRHLGFNRIEIAFDDPDHQHGPALMFVAWM